MRRATVITCSQRAATGVYPDRSGPIAVEALREWGFATPDAVVVPDGDPVGAALARAIQDGVDVVLTCGGTGLTPTDHTPEQTRPLLEREVPGIAEAIRSTGAAKGVPTAVLSRGIAGSVGTTLVVNLPGSTGGVRDALTVLAPILDHARSQLAGGDH